MDVWMNVSVNTYGCVNECECYSYVCCLGSYMPPQIWCVCVWHTYSYAWHDSLICVTWLTYMCDMTHSYVWHDVFIHGRDSCIRGHDSFICVTLLIHGRDMPHSYVRHDSFIRGHDSFISVTWLVHTWTWLTHMRHDSFIPAVHMWGVAYRVAKTRRIPYLYRSFSAKVTYI